MKHIKPLTQTEERLLLYFLKYEGKTVSRKRLLKALWGFVGTNSRVADWYVGQLRKKVKGYVFTPVYGKGYICHED